MPNFSWSNTFSNASEVSRGGQVTQGGVTSVSHDINFSSSGQVVIPNSGDAIPALANLAAVGLYFPGVGTAVKVLLTSSGGLSGLVAQTIIFNSGYQTAAWTCSGGFSVNPLNSLSGVITQITYTNTFLASGTPSSGAARYLYVN